MNLHYIKASISLFLALGPAQNVSPHNAEKLNSSPPARPQAETRSGTNSSPVNLKALPNNISGEDLQALMHDYTRAIGAPCGYCHDENSQTKSIDFNSDANPMKQTARLMIRMTADINTKYLAPLGDRRYAEPVTCGNCHQGHTSPPSFEPKP